MCKGECCATCEYLIGCEEAFDEDRSPCGDCRCPILGGCKAYYIGGVLGEEITQELIDANFEEEE